MQLETQTPSTEDITDVFVRAEGSIEVVVDSEWWVVYGAEELATLLDLKVEEVAGLPLGSLLHPDDLTVSPLGIWRSGQSAALRFRKGAHGHARLHVGIQRVRWLPDMWTLVLTEIDADLHELDYQDPGESSNEKPGEVELADVLPFR